MDRNKHAEPSEQAQGVALRKESVDRNKDNADTVKAYAQSLSARRAWIEITRRSTLKHQSLVALRKESVDRNWPRARHWCCWPSVALRKESVDRNLIDEIQLEFNSLSLSARRAWIEISEAVSTP